MYAPVCRPCGQSQKPCTEILEGRLDEKRRRDRLGRRRTDDIKDWSNRTVAECLRLVKDRQHGDCLYTRWSPTLSNDDENKQASSANLEYFQSLGMFILLHFHIKVLEWSKLSLISVPQHQNMRLMNTAIKILRRSIIWIYAVLVIGFETFQRWQKLNNSCGKAVYNNVYA